MYNFYGSIIKFQVAFKQLTFGLHRKTYLLFSAVSLILMLSLSYLIYINVGKYIIDETNNYLDVLTKTINNNIDQYIMEMRKTLLELSTETSIKNIVNNKYLDDYEKYFMEKSLLNRMRTLISMRKYNDIYLYSEKLDRLISTNYLENSYNHSNFIIKNQQWYQKVISSSNRLVLVSDYSILTNHKVFSGFGLALKVQTDKEGGNGILFLSSALDYFNDMFVNIDNESLKHLIIVDSDGNIIYNFNRTDEKSFKIETEQVKDIINSNAGHNFISEGGQEYLVKVNISPNTGWSTISFIPMSRLKQPLAKVGMLIIYMTGSFILVLLVASYFLSSWITVPVRKLIKVMKQVEGLNFSVTVDIHSNDEIGQLGNSFNLMVNEINRLITQVIESKILEKEAEINALQQQINPHSLYKILESINSLASINGCNEICVIAEKVGRMFRYSIGYRSKELVTIEDEFQHLKDYITIQQIRYSNGFSVAFDINRDILPIKTIKFILQPIVENSVTHGIADMKDGCAIKITGKKYDDLVVIEIEDNGIGIDEQELVALNEYIRQPSLRTKEDEARKSIGLKNVHSRIVLTFGNQFGLEICSSKGIGTNVKVKIPAIERGM